MTIIGGNFTLSGNPVEDLKRYAKTKGISDEEAKKDLQEIYGNPEEKQANVYTNDLGSGKNLDFLSAGANYNLATQNMLRAYTNIEKVLNDKGYENLLPIADLVGNAKVEITYGNGVPCLQVFNETGACVGHMYMDNFEENGENQKNKLIMYGNETKPTTVFQFNNENKLEKIYDSNGNVTNVPSKSDAIKAEIAKIDEKIEDIKAGIDTRIEKLLHDKGYQNLSAIGDFVNNAKVEITYGNGVPCLQVFDENGNCVGHMYMDNFEENGENQKNKLIMYGNETKPTTVFQFNEENKLEQIYDSNGKVTNPNEYSNGSGSVADINKRALKMGETQRQLRALKQKRNELYGQLFKLFNPNKNQPNVMSNSNIDLSDINLQENTFNPEEIKEQIEKDLADLQKNLGEAQEKLSDRLNNFKDFS